ncbi:hypothetical protein [Streptomyces sp. NPDC088246]|uniref:hypothetical protein n=1 Tax=Streptomyces sp. NPDC088246 TaxID=3365842 RepID=UPI0037F2C79D
MAEVEDPHPDGWQAQARQSFLTAMWNMVVDEDAYTDGSPSWIESRSGGHEQGRVPGSASAAALHRILACGVNPDDLTDVVRQMQHDLIYNVCQLIDDPGLLGIGLDEDWSEQTDVRWELVTVRTARPAARAPIDGLHSSLDELDPSGRSGEPRGRPAPHRGEEHDGLVDEGSSRTDQPEGRVATAAVLTKDTEGVAVQLTMVRPGS